MFESGARTVTVGSLLDICNRPTPPTRVERTSKTLTNKEPQNEIKVKPHIEQISEKVETYEDIILSSNISNNYDHIIWL